MNYEQHIAIYGDESVNNNIICYAILVIPTNLVEKAEKIIIDIKDEFNLPKNYFSHCKQLFNGHERERLNFNIDINSIENFYKKLAFKFRTADMIVCYVDKREIKKKKEIIDWENGAKTEVFYGDKELIHFCKNGAMIDIVRTKKDDEYNFYPDPDNKSIMRWNNKKKAKVDNQDYNVIISADTINYKSHPDEMIRTKQIKITGQKPDLLQIADLLAYSFSKAKTVQQYKNKDFFVGIINVMKPISRKFTFERQ